ncbi:MAG TPA: ATP synthase F0 subunit B [Candidatus Acidoferrales bacterium]|nr:ATP synthase F0 subunit B [Candidatus Acidoferrales bacterium]
MTISFSRMGRAWGKPVMFVLTLALVIAAPALAQESEPSPADTNTGWVFRWINFAIVFALIVYGFRKAAPVFRARQRDIAARIAEGTRAREAADAKRHEAEVKLNGLDQEVAQLRADAKVATEGEAQRLRAAAKEDAQKIERAAQTEIAAAERAARIELRSLAARLAVERAEAQLRSELTPKADAALFRGFLEELARSSN